MNRLSTLITIVGLFAVAPLFGQDVHICTCKELPSSPEGLGLAGDTSKFWPKQELSVCFLDGDTDLQEKVISSAQEWSKHCSVTFKVVPAPNADIRISFTPDIGSWSHIGTDALKVPVSKQTMNLGWLSSRRNDITEVNRVVRHEFGHALGLIHELQSPSASIKWNKPVVYAHYAKQTPPWSKEKVDSDVLNRTESRTTNYTSFDKTSIMCYSVPSDFTLDGFSAPSNSELSDLDKQFISASYGVPNPEKLPPGSRTIKLPVEPSQSVRLQVDFAANAPKAQEYSFCVYSQNGERLWAPASSQGRLHKWEWKNTQPSRAEILICVYFKYKFGGENAWFFAADQSAQNLVKEFRGVDDTSNPVRVEIGYSP